MSTRYKGHAFWDVETWQWPTWLVFWPDQARAALQYRVNLMPQAAENAKHLDVYLHDFAPGADLDKHKPTVLEGLRYPWESALSGVELSTPSDENHIVGDISLAFRQYWRATHNVTWLASAGFPVIEGIARYYASRVTLGADGKYHTFGQMGPDEAHGNITDSTYGNAVGAAALTAAYDLAAPAGRTPNATFRRIAQKIQINYNATGDFHPEYNEVQWNDRVARGGDFLIKQADTVLMYYPLAVNATDSVRRNDVELYAKLQVRS